MGTPIRALIAALSILLLAGSAVAQREDRGVELRRIQDEILRLERAAEEARRRTAGVEGELEALDFDLELQRERIREARVAHELAVERAQATQEAIADASGNIVEARTELRRHLASLFAFGRRGYLRHLLTLEPGSDLRTGLRLLRFLALRDGRRIEAVEMSRVRMAEERREALDQQAEVERWLGEEEKRAAQLEVLRNRKQALLERWSREQGSLTERTSELRDRQERLRKLLDLLLVDQGGSEGPSIQEVRGVLDWPVKGKVTTGFGNRRDPRYGTSVPHNGLTLSVSPGSTVQPIFTGRVLFAAPFEGYGPTVVVRHGGDVLSLYAGLTDLAVSEGDIVTPTRRLGASGNELYFEIREKNRPVDPRGWLR